MIKKVGDKYVVYGKSGGKRLGTHNSRKKAEKQFSAFFKKLKIIEFLYLQTPGVVDITPALLAIQPFE